MIILGVICLIVGLVLAIKVLWIIGVVLVAVGACVWAVSEVGHRPIGGRRHWY